MSIVWNNINEGILPELDEPVLLAKEPTENLVIDCRLGCMIEDDMHKNNWFVGIDSSLITLASRQYWTYLLEKSLKIPSTEDVSILSLVLQKYLLKLQLFDKKFQMVAASMIRSGEGLYALDYYILGILNRCSSLIFGFETLIKSSNFISAAHLIRPHLDNYLRLLAAWLVREPHGFAKDIWNGASVRDYRDRDGNKMTDAYLKAKATEEFPWIENVYNETSGFVHFSNKHIRYSTTLSSVKDNTLNTFVGKTDNNISNETKLEAVIVMLEISNAIVSRIYGWIETKRIKG